MKIETKFEIGDTVYFMLRDQLCSSIIIKIQVDVNSRKETIVYYGVKVPNNQVDCDNYRSASDLRIMEEDEVGENPDVILNVLRNNILNY